MNEEQLEELYAADRDEEYVWNDLRELMIDYNNLRSIFNGHPKRGDMTFEDAIDKTVSYMRGIAETTEDTDLDFWNEYAWCEMLEEILDEQ